MAFTDGSTLSGMVPIRDRRYKGVEQIKASIPQPEIEQFQQLRISQSPVSKSQSEKDIDKILTNLNNMFK